MNSQYAAEPLRYEENDGHDYLIGTKSQLQTLGLGVGLAFPGEPGGPKRVLRVKDPRGFDAKITKHWRHDGSAYDARIEFPGLPPRPHFESEWVIAFPGVKRRQYYYFDEYLGSAADLVAAGLVRSGHFPGMPGMRKVCVTVYADGSLPNGLLNANMPRSREPGACAIYRAGASAFRVRCRVSAEEEERRREEEKPRWRAEEAAREDWRRQVRALPRPPRLVPLAPVRRVDTPQRAHLRLVWVAPR